MHTEILLVHILRSISNSYHQSRLKYRISCELDFLIWTLYMPVGSFMLKEWWKLEIIHHIRSFVKWKNNVHSGKGILKYIVASVRKEQRLSFATLLQVRL
jgi:hypothetical protein